MSSAIRVRIAPSPTGDWHLGNARTALFSYFFARQHGGKFFLRIEDTDQARLVPGAVERLLQILEWLGMTPDPLESGEPYFVQSQNLKRYQEVVDQLLESGKAYYCFATQEELDAMRHEQAQHKLPPRYDNRWGYRDLPLAEAKARVAKGDAYVVRQKMPQNGLITFTDLVHGEVSVQAELLDDHVILKSDGFPTYHLAHVVDDRDMKISHVIRGDEWLPSAPRHIVLHQSLGWDLPEYAHLPVILGSDKGKLSKRHGAKPVIEYKQDGYLPEALTNFLALLGWSSGTEQELFSREELIERFDFARVHPSPAVFDKDRLDWFNGAYIRQLPLAELVDRLKQYVAEVEAGWVKRAENNPEKFTAVVASLQDRLTKLSDFPALAEFFYVAPKDYSSDLLPSKKQSCGAALESLRFATDVLQGAIDWSHDGVEHALRQAITARDLKAGDVLWPIRAALTGLPASPGTFDVLAILGRDESLARIAYAISLLAHDQPAAS